MKNNKQVLVCGTPCQIAGIAQKFTKNDNLFLVQLVCHGVPSKKLFDDCCKETFNEIPKEVNFKYHYPSWDNYSIKYSLKDKEVVINQKDDLFMKYFLSDTMLNNCCYHCRFVGKSTGADLIIGDCWGVNSIDKKMYNKDGVSIVKVNSQKGLDLFNSSTDGFNVIAIPKSKVKFSNENIFKPFHREETFYKKAEFVEKYKNNKIRSLNNYMNNLKTKNKSVKPGSKLKRFAKKIIKKLLKI